MYRKEDERKSYFLLSCALICYWHRVIGARVGIKDPSSPVELPLFTDKPRSTTSNKAAEPNLHSGLFPPCPCVFLLHRAARDDSQKPFEGQFWKKGQVWFHLPWTRPQRNYSLLLTSRYKNTLCNLLYFGLCP